MSITHLQFVDDTIVFQKLNPQRVVVIKWILHYFEFSSSLKNNFSKPCVHSMGTLDSVTNEIASALQCSVGNLPFIYLGLPITTNLGSISTWDPIVDKFRQRLAFWQ